MQGCVTAASLTTLWLLGVMTPLYHIPTPIVVGI